MVPEEVINLDIDRIDYVGIETTSQLIRGWKTNLFYSKDVNRLLNNTNHLRPNPVAVYVTLMGGNYREILKYISTHEAYHQDTTRHWIFVLSKKQRDEMIADYQFDEGLAYSIHQNGDVRPKDPNFPTKRQLYFGRTGFAFISYPTDFGYVPKARGQINEPV